MNESRVELLAVIKEAVKVLQGLPEPDKELEEIGISQRDYNLLYRLFSILALIPEGGGSSYSINSLEGSIYCRTYGHPVLRFAPPDWLCRDKYKRGGGFKVNVVIARYAGVAFDLIPFSKERAEELIEVVKRWEEVLDVNYGDVNKGDK